MKAIYCLIFIIVFTPDIVHSSIRDLPSTSQFSDLHFYNDDQTYLKAYSLAKEKLITFDPSNTQSAFPADTYDHIYHNTYWALKQIQIVLVRRIEGNKKILQLRYANGLSNLEMFRKKDIAITTLSSIDDINQIKLLPITDNTLLLIVTILTPPKTLLCIYDYSLEKVINDKDIIAKSLSCLTMKEKVYCLYIANDKLTILKYPEENTAIAIELDVTGLISSDIISHDENLNQVFICVVYSNGESGQFYWNCFIRDIAKNTQINYDKTKQLTTNGAQRIKMFHDSNLTILLLHSDGFELFHYENKSSHKTVIPAFNYIDLKVKNNITYIIYITTGNISPIIEYIPCINERFTLLINLPRVFKAEQTPDPNNPIEISPTTNTFITIAGTTITCSVSNNYSLFYKYKNDQLQCNLTLFVYNNGCKVETTCERCEQGLYYYVTQKKCVYGEDPFYSTKHVKDEIKKEILQCEDKCKECKRIAYQITQCVKCEKETNIIYQNKCHEKCPANTYSYDNNTKCTNECYRFRYISAIQNGDGICLEYMPILDADTTKKLTDFKAKTDNEKEKAIKAIVDSSVSNPPSFNDLCNIQLFYMYLNKDNGFPSALVEERYHETIFTSLETKVFYNQNNFNTIIKDKNSREMIISIITLIAIGDIPKLTDENKKSIRALFMSFNIKTILQPIIDKTAEYKEAANAFIVAFIKVNESTLTISNKENALNFGDNIINFSKDLKYRYAHSSIKTPLSQETIQLNIKTTLQANELWDKASFDGDDYRFYTSDFPPQLTLSLANSFYVRLNTYFADYQDNYTDSKVIQMMDSDQYNAIILFPFKEISDKLDSTKKNFANVIIYKSKYPYLNPNIKEIHGFVFSMRFHDDQGNEIPLLSLTTQFKFVIPRPDIAYDYCMYYNSVSKAFETSQCQGKGVNQYIICECHTLQPFSISTFSPDDFNKKLPIKTGKFFQPAIELNGFEFKKGKSIYIIIALFALYAIGLGYAIAMDIKSNNDPLVIIDEGASSCKCCYVDIIMRNADNLGNEIYKEDSPNMSFLYSVEQISPKIHKKQTPKPKRRTMKQSTQNPSPNSNVKKNNQILFELKNKEFPNDEISMGELHLETNHEEEDEENNNKINKSPTNIKRKKKSNDNEKENDNEEKDNNTKLFYTPNYERKFCVSFCYFIQQEYTLVSLFILDVQCNSKVVLVTLLILRLFLLLSVVSLFASCHQADAYSFTGDDILYSFVSVLIVDVFFTICKAFVIKKKVNPYDLTPINRIKSNKVMVILLTIMIAIGFCVYGVLNCLCISVINYDQKYYCNIIEDFFIALAFDWCIIEILMVTFKAFLFYCMVSGKPYCVKTMASWIVAFFPWFIPIIAWC